MQFKKTKKNLKKLRGSTFNRENAFYDSETEFYNKPAVVVILFDNVIFELNGLLKYSMFQNLYRQNQHLHRN